MKAEYLIECASRLHPMQGVTIRFNKDSITGLIRLMDLIEGNQRISITEHEKAVMLAVLNSRNWGNDQNRSYLVFGMYYAIPKWFAENAEYIESVDAGDHGVKSLLTGRQKRQNEVAQEIIDQVLIPDLKKETEDRGLKVSGNLVVRGEIPSLHFYIGYDAEHTAYVSIDGFSGVIVSSHRFVNDGQLYFHPSQIQQLLRTMFQKTVEELHS